MSFHVCPSKSEVLKPQSCKQGLYQVHQTIKPGPKKYALILILLKMPKTAAQLQSFAVNCLWISSFVVGNHHLIAGEVNFKYYSRPSIVIHMEYKTGMAVVPCTLAIKE